jgi:WD40 repeat protein/transcriptional regulator with XRE-family HTH domain
MPVSSVVIALDRFTTFGDLLKYLRRRAGLTQRELSIAVGYSDAQISRLEQNERLPDLATLTARFLPALYAEDQPEVAMRLLELAAAVRREDAPAAGLAPYKGLYFFDEADAELFFGREDLTTSLVERLTAELNSDQRFLAVIGASGSGKSSVVRAGLIPALRWRQPSSEWPIYVMTPTAHPLEALESSLRGDYQRGVAGKKLVPDHPSYPEFLELSLERIKDAVGAQHVLFVVDQFEELFTLCRSEAEQAAFVENLISAAFQPRGVAIVMVVMRADFYAHCARFDLLRQALARHQEYIGPMTSAQLRHAIEEPAKRNHWEIEPGLAEILLHDVSADAGRAPEPGALPLLSHALLETWRRRRGRTLTLSGYSASGGVRGAIAETAEAVFYDQLDPQQRNIARQIFLRLTELGGDDSMADTRRRVSFDELISKPEDRDTVHEVLMTLADARLVTTDQDVAEVAHEALIREWPTLRNWLEEDREGLRLHRHLTVSAQEWELSGREPSGLYRGARLAQSLEWANTHAEDLNSLEHAFIEASLSFAEKEAIEREAQRQRELDAARQLAEAERIRAEEQILATKQLRKRGAVLTAVSILTILLTIATILFSQRAIQNEQLSTSRELAAAATSNLQIDPERSVLLALQALDAFNTLEARNALHQSLPELHILHTISAHSSATNVQFSSDGNRIVSIGVDATKVWDSSTYQLLLSLPVEVDPTYGSAVAFSPDGRLLATAVNTGIVIWDSVTGQKLLSFDGNVRGSPNNEMAHVSFSPDSKRLAVANMDGAPKVWDIATRKELFSLIGHTRPCDGIDYSPDGRLIATSDDAGIVKVWDSASGHEFLSLTHSGNIHSVAFSPDSKSLASGSEDGTLKVWETATGNGILSLRGASGLYGVAFMPDGKQLVAAGQDGTVRVWDVVSGLQLLTLAGNTSTVTSVSISPDGKRIASSGYDGTVKIWDASPGRELHTIMGHTDVVWDVAYSYGAGMAWLGSVSADGTAKLWDPATGQAERILSQNDGLTSLAFSPNGKHLATGTTSGNVILWDIHTGQSVMTLPVHTDLVFHLAFSPDGGRMVTSSWDGTAKLLDLALGREVLSFPDQWSGVAFSPDGRQVFTGGLDGYVYLWDASTGQELRKYSDGSQDVYGVAISPDGNLLAIGQQGGTITLWDVDSGTKLRALSGHAGLINQLAFSRDGTRLASASFDRLAKVWDVASGEELLSLYGNTGNVFGVAFSPDGQYLATAGADGTVRTYSLRLEELVAQAHSRVTRALTAEECRKYLHKDQCPSVQ